jgi:hypothetical protein
MISLQRPQLAGSMANIIPFDESRVRGRSKSLFARCLAGVLRALHDSRMREGERVIRRYRHLICVSDVHDDGRRPDAVSARK